MPRILSENAAKTTLADIPNTREGDNTKLSIRKDNVLVSKQGALSRFFTLPSTVSNINQRIVDNFVASMFGETEHLSKNEKDQIQGYWRGRVAHKHRITAGTLREMQRDVISSEANAAREADAMQAAAREADARQVAAKQADAMRAMRLRKATTAAQNILAILDKPDVKLPDIKAEIDAAMAKLDQPGRDAALDALIEDNPALDPVILQELDARHAKIYDDFKKVQQQKREDIIRCMMDTVDAEGEITMEHLNLITKDMGPVLANKGFDKLNKLFPNIETDLKGIVIQRHNPPKDPPPVPPKKAEQVQQEQVQQEQVQPEQVQQEQVQQEKPDPAYGSFTARRAVFELKQ
jgi:hypothetical protein